MQENKSDFLEEYSGVGLEDIRQRIPYVSITQDGKRTGDWRYSPDPEGNALGDELRFIPVFTYDVWVERSGTGKDVRTVAYHAPNSIPLIKTTTPQFSITHAETGNRIDCTVAIGMIIEQYTHYPHKGFGLYIPTVLSLRNIRKWQNTVAGLTLNSGNKAPIFAFRWTFKTGDIEGKQAVIEFVQGDKLDKETFDNFVKPLLNAKEQYQLIQSKPMVKQITE